MVIVCQKCQTRFQLDESRIPAKGARVRCSRCKHAFVVVPPGVHDETVHRLAEEAAASGRPSVPGPSIDLPGGRRSQRAGAREEAEDDDWEFNIDPPAAPAPAPSSRPATAAAPAPRAAAKSAPPRAAAAKVAPEPPPAEGDDGIESLFELGGLRDAEPAVLEGEITDSDPTPFDDSLLRPPASAPAAASSAGDGWDFAPDDAGAPPAAAPRKSARGGRGASRAGTGAARAASAADSAGAQAGAGAASAASAGAPARRDRGVRLVGSEPGMLARALGAAAFAPVVALFAFGLIGSLRGAPVERELPPQPAGRLELAAVRARHLDNYWSGPLLVVQGELRNPGRDAVALGGAPQVRVTGAEEDAPAPAWLGAALHESALRERDPRELVAALEHSARQLAARPLRPGEEVLVQAIVESPPLAASGLRVELAPVPRTATAAAPPASLDAPASEGASDDAARADGTASGDASGEPATESGDASADGVATAPAAP